MLARAASEYLPDSNANITRGPAVSAKLFITVEHGGSGFGWCVLPCALVEEFAAEKPLAQLEVPGWPRAIAIDLLWNKKTPPGTAGNWLATICSRNKLRHRQISVISFVIKLTFLNNQDN